MPRDDRDPAPGPAPDRDRDRDFDLVLFGATGFTGRLTAQYLARHAPPGTRWALAGRNREKLVAVRTRLAAADPALTGLPLLTADAADPGSLRAVAEAARVVVTTVGPYLHHGDGLVAACAAAGTDYADLTGEPEFTDRTYLRHHAAAVASGARLVHCCGFDSVPCDLGVYRTVQQLPEGVPLRVEGFVRVSASFSGGTLHSAVTALSRPRASARTARERRAAENRERGGTASGAASGTADSSAGRTETAGRRVRGLAPRLRRTRRPAGWALPLPVIDPQVVLRSARALERYGPDFSYGHYLHLKRLPAAAAVAGGAAGLTALAQLPPARRRLLSRRRPGEGPSPERRAASWFSVRIEGEGGGRRVVTEVSGGDPGYDETAKMLAESALCLAFDDLPPVSGQVTTAVAMGEALTRRLVAAGLTFRTTAGPAPAR